MSLSYTRLALMIIISTIVFQFLDINPGRSILIDENEISGSQFQIPESNALICLNESKESFSWSDETGVLVPLFQDHFTLGNDKWQNDTTLYMVVLGDSIAWGAGLEREEKYYYLVAKWLQEKLKMPVEVIVLAHTGATLAKPENIEKSERGSIDPELSSWNPTLFEQADLISNSGDVDLILLSGGINDVRVNNILNPMTAPEEMRSLCDGIEDPMYGLLIKLINKCPNSDIIVTSYYPIVSNDTSEKALDIFINELRNCDPNSIETKGFSLIKSLFGTKRILDLLSNNSRLFNDQSILSMGRAIIRANQYCVSQSKEPKVIFALVDFPSNRSYGTNESWLWEITDPKTNMGRLTNDHNYDYRISICNESLCSWNDLITAIGHPNVKGADEYNRTIIDAMSKI